MSIRKIIDTPVETREVVVEHKGEKYYVVGRPDATLLGRVTLKTEDQRANLAKHLNNITGAEFDGPMVLNVELVQTGLQVREPDQDFDPDERYDVTEIARLAVNDGGLFLKLVAAAAEVFGFGEDGTGIDEALAGESGGEEGSSSASPDEHSK